MAALAWTENETELMLNWLWWKSEDQHHSYFIWPTDVQMIKWVTDTHKEKASVVTTGCKNKLRYEIVATDKSK